jgi:hypothetical protein
LLAIVSEQPLPLDWLPPDHRTPARVLNQTDVKELLTVPNSLPVRNWVALSTYFDVLE